MKWFFGSKDDLADAHAVRRAVFLDEQGIAEADEFDGTDAQAVHLVIYDEDIPVCTGRVLVEEFKIGRVSTVMTHRGRGLATGLMQALIQACLQMGGRRQTVHAQTAAQGFYEKLGFTPIGEVFTEAGIPHIAMEHFGSASSCGGGGGGHTCTGCGRH
jgi:ElaA protein